MVVNIGNIKLEITEYAFDKIKKYKQTMGLNEAGGILLGGYISEDNKYVITDISEPNSTDYATPTSFIRGGQEAQSIINLEWKNSDGKINYLGEWHTHGCVNPVPSLTDKKLLCKLVKDKSNVWDEIFMIIMGNTGNFYIGVGTNDSKGKITNEIFIRKE